MVLYGWRVVVLSYERSVYRVRDNCVVVGGLCISGGGRTERTVLAA